MKSIVIFILKIPFFILKGIGKFIMTILKFLMGMIFGWIPDLDERMSGEKFEEYVQAVLIRNGYKNVKLTKHSGDYGIDLLAEYKGVTYALQCKLYARPVGVAAVQQAYAGAVYYQCDQSVVVTNHRFTAQAIALAKTNGVLLWDGDDLNHFKRKANSHALFHRNQKTKENCSPYQTILELLVNEGYASKDLLIEQLGYSEEKAYYTLDDLQFHDLISPVDHMGISDLYFSSIEEALTKLET